LDLNYLYQRNARDAIAAARRAEKP